MKSKVTYLIIIYLGTPKKRPKSLAISTQTKLLSLEEAQNRVLTSARRADPNYIEVGWYKNNYFYLYY